MSNLTEHLKIIETNAAVNTTDLKMRCPFFLNHLLYNHDTRLFHLISTILLAVTAIFHSYVEAESQNVAVQQCIFHLAISLCVIHFEIFFFASDRENSFSFHFDYAIIIFGLASFLWSSMLAYQLWKNFGKYGKSNEAIGIWSRLLLGYGIPSIFVISALGPTSSNKTREEMFCSVIVPLAISFAVPIQIVNNFFFIDLLRKALRRILWYSYDKSINLQEHIYKVLVFIMLYYNLALPWLVIMVYEFLSSEAKIEKPMEIYPLIRQIFSADGIFLSFVLIVYHKYAWKNSSIEEEKSWESVAYEKVDHECVTLWEKSVA